MLQATDFAGDWTLARTIDDRFGDQQNTFDGKALLHGVANTLLYQESGQMRLSTGAVLNANRAYHWQFDQSEVIVTFSDGRDFHRFVPWGQTNGTDHPCGDDFYRVAYDFSCWPHWTATWHVTGPRKDYTMVSTYRR